MPLMNVAAFTAPGKVELQKKEIPNVRPSEILVNVKACGICTFDCRLFAGEKRMSYPIVAGHEAAGVVVEVGSRVRRDIKPGSRVALDLLNRCGECHYCRTGHGNLCENVFKSGDLNVLGGFGEYVSVPSNQVFPMGESVSYEEACLAEPLSCCIHSLRRVGGQFGDDLVVYGAGPMGMLHVLLGVAMGMRVIVVEPQSQRRALAKKLGARGALEPGAPDVLQGQVRTLIGGPPDIIVVATPSVDAVLSAASVSGPLTRIVLFSTFPKGAEFSLDPSRIHYNEIVVTGSNSRASDDFELATKAISSGIIDVRPMVSKVVPLEDIGEALSEAPGPDVMRVVVRL